MTARRRVLVVAAAVLLAPACSSGTARSGGTPTTVARATTTSASPVPSTATTLGTTTSTALPPTTSTTTTMPPTTTRAETVRRVFPIAGPASYGRTHHDYPATDVFAGCGASVVAPVDGTLLEVRRTDSWSPATDNPATRGGRSLSILGNDGVRYYLAHLDTIDATLTPGGAVAAGQPVATVGRTGRASGCHLHVALSPPCPGKEWAVRRGVVWPWPYLDAWRAGSPTSPAPEVQAWAQQHSGACAEAMADPAAPEA